MWSHMWILNKLYSKMRILNLYCFCFTRFSHKQHFYKQCQAEIGKRLNKMLSNTMKLNLPFENYSHSSITLSSKSNRTYSKKEHSHEIMRLIIMKMKIKMKNRWHKYDIIDQGLDTDTNIVNIKSVSVFFDIYLAPKNMWSSIHEKVEQHWGWVKEKRCL